MLVTVVELLEHMEFKPEEAPPLTEAVAVIDEDDVLSTGPYISAN
jgi:2-phospho-L-lactate transferase/gluconeogenesis factor (CofD/UPF0052 family)